MDEFFGQQPLGEKSVPPPPEIPESPPGLAEVTIRTMTSDIGSLIQSGGLAQTKKLASAVHLSPKKSEEPKPEEVTLMPGHTPPELAQAIVASAEEPAPKSHLVWWLVGGLMGAAALFLVGYYLIPIFFPPPPQTTELEPRVSLPEPRVEQPESKPEEPAPEAVFTHQSFFRIAPDETLLFSVSPATGTAALRAYGQGLSSVLKAAAPTSTFFEIGLEDAAGKPWRWFQLVNLFNLTLPPDFWESNFEPDFTLFVYEDKNGLWPGYVLRLKTKTSPLLLQSDILKLESGLPVLRNFFLGTLGTPVGNFRDAQVSGQPVRSLQFSTPGANFNYGWFFEEYLVFSTSLDGTKRAIERF